LAGSGAAGALLVMAENGFPHSVLHTLRRFGFDRRRVCVVGTWETARELARRFAQSPAWGFHVACVGVGPAETRQFLRFPDGASLGESLTAVLDSQVVDEVLLAVPAEEVVAERSTLALCDQYGVMGRLLLRPPGREHAVPAQVDDLCGAPALAIGGPRYDDRLMAFKRVVDVLLSLVLLGVLLPLLAAIAVMVKLSSPGPVIFSQQRIGLHGRRFWFYKFRTMVDGAETMLPAVAHRSITGGPIFKDPVDVRVTRVGRILRRFSLDELPQLINVIRGQMSLVGPRPLPLHEAAAVVGVNRRRFSMRPGLTCLWQVNGRSDVDYVTWMQYDLEYVDRWSLMLDLKLLLRTIPVVFTGRGAY
jgi:exopolysaccharide biosynthesis polyprenyl glycosylphosphotransferase